LRFAEFGHRNFPAVDLDVREAIAFLSEGLIEDRVGLTRPILHNLFCMTVAVSVCFPCEQTVLCSAKEAFSFGQRRSLLMPAYRLSYDSDPATAAPVDARAAFESSLAGGG
jgi:hypothetical protein